MLLASRADPPKHLQVPASKARNTSALREFLLHSPLPSPALPSILPRHGKKPPKLNTRRMLRCLSWIFILTVTISLIQFLRGANTSIKEETRKYQHANGQAYEIVEDSQLPDFASPLAVQDSEGSSKWTIHIPSNRGFPLKPHEYRELCSHVDEVARHVAVTEGNDKELENARGYYDQDPNYIDVAEAQLTDLVPFDPSFKPTTSGVMPMCKSSLIYVLDSEDAGLGGSLLGLWLSYGLAQREKRSFFVDDSHFSYGSYASLFERPPSPNCRPAPPTHRVPCPRMSQHLVVSAATWHWTFGNAFRDKFSDKEIFEMMRVGYETLFKLLPDDQLAVAQRVTELRNLIGKDNVLAGMHIRKGDKHPDEFQYQWGYIPATEYSSTLKSLVEEASTSLLVSSTPQKFNHTFVLASDDESMYRDSILNSFGTILRAQECTTQSQTSHSITSSSPGLQRGFYRDAFWSLGLPKAAQRSKHTGSPMPTKDSKYEQRVLGNDNQETTGVGDLQETFGPDRDYRSTPTPQARKERSELARSYLRDLAILAQSDRLVCAVSSRGCRILGVMMGWDNVSKGHWKNIDQGLSLGWRAEL